MYYNLLPQDEKYFLNKKMSIWISHSVNLVSFKYLTKIYLLFCLFCFHISDTKHNLTLTFHGAIKSLHYYIFKNEWKCLKSAESHFNGKGKAFF